MQDMPADGAHEIGPEAAALPRDSLVIDSHNDSIVLHRRLTEASLPPPAAQARVGVPTGTAPVR